MDKGVIENIGRFLELGYSSTTILCKTYGESMELYNRLKDFVNIKLISSIGEYIETGAMIIPIYMAKGLEFDSVIVYNVSEENYQNEFDRKLLYVAATRALHNLSLYYVGKRSPLIT